MPRTRAELLRLHILHKAAAAAFEAELKDRATGVFEDEGSADTWRLPLGQVVTNLNQPRAYVTDLDALTDYLEQHTAAVTRHEVRTINPDFLERFLKDLGPEINWDDEDDQQRYARPGEVFDVEVDGKRLPGVRYTTGGTLSSVSIRPDPEARRTANLSMTEYVAGDSDQPF